MKGFCIKSLAIGLGIGMILTASFNIFMEGRPASNIVALEEQSSEGMEKSIGDLKKNLDKPPLNEEVNDLVDEEAVMEEVDTEDSDIAEDEDLADIDDTQDEEELDYFEVYIFSGMNSTDIAEVLYQAGVIENPTEFVNHLIKKKATKNIRIGSKIIPKGSSYDEIIEILLKV